MQPRDMAEQALQWMSVQGFDAAQVDVSRRQVLELNIANNEPSLMRSAEQHQLGLAGLVDGRRAATELTDLREAAVRQAVAELHAQAAMAPRDEAHAVSSGQRARIVKGDVDADEAALGPRLAGLVGELLDFRAGETPSVVLQEATASHVRLSRCTLTSQGSDLALESAWHELMVFGSAREGARSSSFNWAGGAAHGIEPGSAMAHFGMADMLRALTRQLQPRGLGGKFVGTVVLTPWAVSSLLDWLLTQLGDTALIGGSSLLAGRVGQGVASPLLGVHSRFDAPGVVPWSADACVARPVQVMSRGQLLTLLPSLYGARRTGHPHCPVAATGWAIDAGETPLAGMTAGVARGALVGRLSMGQPASNGDFSGVIKNSFAIDAGAVGPALSETMISGNIGAMLAEVSAVSRERIDSGAQCLPWLRIDGLHFS